MILISLPYFLLYECMFLSFLLYPVFTCASSILFCHCAIEKNTSAKVRGLFHLYNINCRLFVLRHRLTYICIDICRVADDIASTIYL